MPCCSDIEKISTYHGIIQVMNVLPLFEYVDSAQLYFKTTLSKFFRY